MSVNLRALLEEMIEKEASDLHITAGERPSCAWTATSRTRSVTDVLTPKDTLALAYSVLTENQKKRFETEDELDFSFGIQNLARFRGNVYKQRGCVVDGHPHDSLQCPHLPGARPAAGRRQAGGAAARPDPGDRPDGLGQVHHARGDHRQDQQGAEGSHHHGGRPDRVHPPPPELHRQPARGRHRHQELRRRAQVRAARGPGRHPGRRNARPGDHRGGAHHRRDRSPCARDAAHQLGGGVDQPHHRRLPLAASSRRSGPSSRSCSRA